MVDWSAIVFPDDGMDFEEVNANTVMAVSKRYSLNGAGSLDMTLPAQAPANSRIEIISELTTNGFVIKQNAGQLIHFLNITTTTGVGGSITLLPSAGVLKGSITLVCLVDDLVWAAYPAGGNFDPV